VSRPPLGDKPWKPYPSQLAVLLAVADGTSLSQAGRDLGLDRQEVAERLSGCYDRLGIKEPQTFDEANEHPLSRWRRAKAVEVCRAHGWLEDES
jgi:hypothetical protein